MKRITVLFFSIICTMVLAGMACAADSNIKVQELDARYSYISCRVDLVQSEAGILSSYGNATGTDKLTSDLTQLKGFADAGDAAGFNTMTQTLNNDFKTLNDWLKATRQSFAKANISEADKNTLRSEWNSTLATYKTCNINTQKAIVTVREELLQNDIDNWNAVIANMTARGLDTSSLQTVVSDAQKLLSELSNASQATDDATFRNMINDANDQRLHVWARFAIGRIDANIARIEPIAGQANLTGKVYTINSLLNSASAMATPGHKYSSGEFEQTWQDIKDASTQVNALSKDLRAYAISVRAAAGTRLGNSSSPRNFTGRPGGLRGNLSNRRPVGPNPGANAASVTAQGGQQ